VARTLFDEFAAVSTGRNTVTGDNAEAETIRTGLLVFDQPFGLLLRECATVVRLAGGSACPAYSWRRACEGSARAARRAGPNIAANAVETSSSDTVRYAIGS